MSSNGGCGSHAAVDAAETWLYVCRSETGRGPSDAQRLMLPPHTDGGTDPPKSAAGKSDAGGPLATPMPAAEWPLAAPFARLVPRGAASLLDERAAPPKAVVTRIASMGPPTAAAAAAAAGAAAAQGAQAALALAAAARPATPASGGPVGNPVAAAATWATAAFVDI